LEVFFLTTIVWKFDSGDPLYIAFFFVFASKYARALQRIVHFVDGHPNNLRFKAFFIYIKIIFYIFSLQQFSISRAL